MMKYVLWIVIVLAAIFDSTGQEACANWTNLPNQAEITALFKSYRESLKNNDFASAFEGWLKVFESAPAGDGKRSYVFDDGIKIYTRFFGDEKDNQKKKDLVAKIMSLYDQRFICFPTKANVDGQKAFEYYFTFTGYASDDEIWSLFKKAWDKEGMNAGYFMLNPTTAILVKQIQDKKVPIEEGRKYISLIQSVLEHGLKNCKDPKDCEPWNIIKDFVPARLTELEKVAGYYDCNYYFDTYYKAFEAEPMNCEVINTAYEKLKTNKCNDIDERWIKLKAAKEKYCKKNTGTKK